MKPEKKRSRRSKAAPKTEPLKRPEDEGLRELREAGQQVLKLMRLFPVDLRD
jgi:hypothetical protein